MRKIAFLALTLFALLPLFAQFAGRYDIYFAGEKTGECRFEFRKHPLGYVLSSTATMTISGTQTISEARTYLDQGYHPKSYEVTITSPAGKQEVSAKFAQGKASLVGSFGVQQSEQEIDFPSNGYILDQHSFAHWWVLGKVINPKVGNFSYNIIIPQLMSAQKLTMKNIEEKFVEGENVTIFEGTLGELDVGLMISDDGKVLSVSFPSQRLEAKLAELKSLAEEEAAIPGGYNPIKPEDLSDRDFMKRMLKGKKFEGHLRFNPHGRLDRIYLNRRAQVFIGVIDQDSISGDVEVRRMNHRVTLAGKWPLESPLETDPEYTSPAPSIDSDDEEVQKQAEKIVASSPTVWEAARAINLWVNRTIEYALLRYDAKDAIIKGKGDSHTKATLCVAMLRAVNIPARVVRGILMMDVPLDHSWVEVFLGQEIGWAPMDPTTGEVDKISARHISLWIGEEEPPVYVKDIQVDVRKMK